jgi:hypothetical protein
MVYFFFTINVKINQRVINNIYEVTNELIQPDAAKYFRKGEPAVLKSKNKAETEEEQYRGKQYQVMVGSEKRKILVLQLIKTFIDKNDQIQERANDESVEVE